MSQKPEPQKNDKNQKIELDPETIKAIVAQKGAEIQLEVQRLRIEEKRIDRDGKLSERSMELNSEFLKNYPKQHRQTIITYGIFITLIIFGILGFIGYCVNTGNKELAKDFLTVITHITTLVVGIVVGRQSNKKKSKDQPQADEPEDAEIVD